MRAAAVSAVLAMSVRNLARHRVKTIITIVAVTVSVALYIFMDAWILGMNLDSRRNIVNYEIGSAKLQRTGYFEKKDDLPMYESFGGWEELARSLSEAGYRSAPRFVFSGTLYSRSGTAPILFNGIDPQLETQLLLYPAYLESGRFIESGKLEVVLGTFAAEKLRVGIPTRVLATEFDEQLLSAAENTEEAAFISSLYVPLVVSATTKQSFSVFDVAEDPNGLSSVERLVLRDDIMEADRARLWTLLGRSGRMDVRISTVIDVVAAPESIREERFKTDLLDRVGEAESALLRQAYIQDPLLGDFFLESTDPATLEALLAIMKKAGYSGAIRHVNQLIDAVVVGVLNTPNPKLNGNIAFLPLDALQDERGMMLNGQVTELLIRAADANENALPGRLEKPEVISAALRRTLKEGGNTLPEGLAVYGWLDYAADYAAAAAGDNVSTRIMALFLFVLSFIGIANTMLMAVMERTKEIGMMRALGMTDGQLLLSYAFEAGLVGLIGSLIGIALGCLLNIPMVNTGIDFSAMSKEMGGDFGYRIASVFRSAWNLGTIIGTGVVATLVSALMALPPTLRALRLPVTETLRFE